MRRSREAGVRPRRRTLRASLAPGLFAIGVAVLLGASAPVTPALAQLGLTATIGAVETQWIGPALGSFSKIQHVVIVMMENRAYDNYFGVYCQKKSTSCPSTGNGVPTGTCVPVKLGHPILGCIKPFNLTPAHWTGDADLAHTWVSSRLAINNGSMNGFYDAEGMHNYTFGHFNGSTLPVYWDMAEEFGLSDNFFSSIPSYSLPNHWYLVAGQSPADTLGSGVISPNWTVRHTYLNDVNVTPSIEQELANHSSTSWTYFDYPLAPTYNIAISGGTNTSRGAYDDWNPLGAK
ncbi:MAG: hypothetical protein L3J91_06160, partial [Thermoplasmata archaeon]|nr:hypothetical protein [Thermoplasmata archaeon]